MICESVNYSNFRNIESQKIEFSPSINLIYGKNAQGKTNALEGVWIFAGGRSHRASKDMELVRFGTECATVKLKYADMRRESELFMRIPKKGRRVCTKNDVVVRKMSEFIGNFRAVLFTPEHLSIVKDGPAARRSFLDSALCQISCAYVSDLQEYNRVLLQRNRLLSDHLAGKITLDADDEQLDVWTQKLAAACEKVAIGRWKYTVELSALVGEIFEDMTSGTEKVKIEYPEPLNFEGYLSLMREHIRQELYSGVSAVGVHKHDLDIKINGNTIRSFGSQGQQRSAALAMKIAEGEISKRVCGEYPVFLFDDILSELDSVRKSYIMSGISQRQVIITSCEDIETEACVNRILCENGIYKN